MTQFCCKSIVCPGCNTSSAWLTTRTYLPLGQLAQSSQIWSSFQLSFYYSRWLIQNQYHRSLWYMGNTSKDQRDPITQGISKVPNLKSNRVAMSVLDSPVHKNRLPDLEIFFFFIFATNTLLGHHSGYACCSSHLTGHGPGRLWHHLHLPPLVRLPLRSLLADREDLQLDRVQASRRQRGGHRLLLAGGDGQVHWLCCSTCLCTSLPSHCWRFPWNVLCRLCWIPCHSLWHHAFPT